MMGSMTPTPASPGPFDAAPEAFHPAVAAWFRQRFDAPTPAQIEAWPTIGAGRSTLVAAPTGSGKTLTAFLAAYWSGPYIYLQCQNLCFSPLHG